MRISSLLPRTNGRRTDGKRIKAVAALPEQGPGTRESWHAVLRQVSRAGGGQPLPDRFIGRVEQETDAEICLTKGEILLACGQPAAAKRFLRAAPGLCTTRAQLCEITNRAASKDADFIELILAGDQARDAGRWSEGERRYAEGLALYPAHSGYLVQYAHCLKEQQQFAEAEVHYRSALALGAALGAVGEHLDFVTARQGYRDLAGGVPIAAQQEAGSMMDAPPTKDDIDLVFRLLTGHSAADTAEVLQILRTRQTIADVFIWVIGQQRFRDRNRDLLGLIADGALQP